MIAPVRRFARNTAGRDLIVGDVHGNLSGLRDALRAIGFNPAKAIDADGEAIGDRLFHVGDLVDRGAESLQAVMWLAEPFVFAVAGNHEDMAIRWPNGQMDRQNYAVNGGAWMIALDRETQLEVAATLSALPVAIEIETEHGLVGIVHAECPFDDWHAFTHKLEDRTLSSRYREQMIDAAQWSRNRIQALDESTVAGVRAVVVGHTPMDRMTSLGNTIFIDTKGWLPGRGHFTILDAATLQPAMAPQYEVCAG